VSFQRPQAKKPPSLNVALVAAIQAFVDSPKNPIGVEMPQQWQLGREGDVGEYAIKIPLEISGQIGEQRLIVLAYPNIEPLAFRILITFEPAICRLDYEHGVIHTNTQANAQEDVPAIVKGPHYHPWLLNKRFFTTASAPIKLHNAVELQTEIRSFDSALRWFCAENNISLPHNHRIELPSRTTLI